jgi:hypothetical protein
MEMGWEFFFLRGRANHLWGYIDLIDLTGGE